MAVIALRVDPEAQTVEPGLAATFTIHVVNQSAVVDRVALDVLGTAQAWSSIEPQALALFPGADASAVLVVTPPLETPLGPVPLGVRATVATSRLVEVCEATLDVGARRTIEAELRPRTTTGKRRAASVVVLHNLGNTPTAASVAPTDPDDAIVFDVPDPVEMEPSAVVKLPLRMRLPARGRQGATLPYQVLVKGDGIGGQRLDGQVRQPPKTRLPILVALITLGLLAAAILYLKPDNSVAIRDVSSVESTTSTILAPPTTALNTIAGPNAPADPSPGATPPLAPPGSSDQPPGTTGAPTVKQATVTSARNVVSSPSTQTTTPCVPTSLRSTTGYVTKNTPTLVMDIRDHDQITGREDYFGRVDPPPQHGTAVIGPDRQTITYTPAKDYLGPDTLTAYEAPAPDSNTPPQPLPMQICVR